MPWSHGDLSFGFSSTSILGWASHSVWLRDWAITVVSRGLSRWFYRKAPLNTTEVTQQKCKASSGRWPRGGLTLVNPCGLLALKLRHIGPVCDCDGGVEMSGV
ncbi:hypothetical protein ACOMHN_008769 [Nucella lapillus]